MLDPLIYTKGKSITVVGTIATPERGKIGEQNYLYPVLQAQGIHLWKKIQKIDVQINSAPFWYDPFFYPYYQRPVIVYSRNRHRVNQTISKSKSVGQLQRQEK